MTARLLKASDAEKAAEAHLRRQGWTVHRARAMTVHPKPGVFFALSHDVWGAIDLVAMHPDHGFLFVQVTTAQTPDGRPTGVTNRKRKVEALPWPIPRSRYQVQVWGSRTTQGSRFFRVWDYDPEAKAWSMFPSATAVEITPGELRSAVGLPPR